MSEGMKRQKPGEKDNTEAERQTPHGIVQLGTVLAMGESN